MRALIRACYFIRVSYLSQTLWTIRSALTENHHAAAGLLRLLHRFGGCKSIGTPAQPTQPLMRALVRSSCRHLCEQHGSNSGGNPSRINREPPCCSWASPSPSPSRWAASPSEHLRIIRASTCLRSSEPAVCIHASSLSRILGMIRAELAEILYHVETDPVRRRLALRSIRRRTSFGRIGALRAFR